MLPVEVVDIEPPVLQQHPRDLGPASPRGHVQRRVAVRRADAEVNLRQRQQQPHEVGVARQDAPQQRGLARHRVPEVDEGAEVVFVLRNNALHLVHIVGADSLENVVNEVGKKTADKAAEDQTMDDHGYFHHPNFEQVTFCSTFLI